MADPNRVHFPAQWNGIKLVPFDLNSGMHGLPRDFMPPSRFVWAIAFTQTMLPFADADSGVPQIAHLLANFDIPIGLVREGMSKRNVVAGQSHVAAQLANSTEGTTGSKKISMYEHCR